MNAIKELARLAHEAKKVRFPHIPPHAVPRPKYKEKDANGLTKCIMDFLKLRGCYAVRINTQGQWQPKLGRFTKSQTKRGTADIHAVVNGKHLSVEVKVGKDRQSEHQKNTEAEIHEAGGLYFIARDFQGFYDWFEKTKGEQP